MKVGNDFKFANVRLNSFGSEPYLIKIGNHVEIASGVRFITHDGGMWIFRKQYPDIDVFGPIYIGDNVMIGMNSILLPGIRIGDNCVIGAGSVVSRDIPSNTVAAGVPARPLKSIDAYFEASKPSTSYIRSLPQTEKKKILEEKFKNELS